MAVCSNKGMCVCVCLQETRGACAARLHLFRGRRGRSPWSSPAAAPMSWQALVWGKMLLVLFLWNGVGFFPLYFGGENNCSSKYVS